MIASVLEAELSRGVSEGVFPSGAAAVAVRDEPVVAAATQAGTTYDIASLTKPFVALSAHRLRSRGLFDIDEPLGALWPALAARPVGAETGRALLSHRAGLPAWLPLFESADVALAAATAPTDGPRPLYSDLGYILLGALLERLAGIGLAELVAREVVGPLGLGSVRYGPVPASEAQPTGSCAHRGRPIRGEVNDENAAAMGGVAGHAGLFARVSDVCELGRAMLRCLQGRSDFLSPELTREAVTADTPGTHALGFDTTKPVDSSAGRRMGPRTFGHLGFTGCSLWVDPDAALVVALLTNRVHPSRENVMIRAFRPLFHDAVFDAATRR